MPMALVPAIIGLVGSLVGTVGGALSKGGQQDPRNKEQKAVAASQAADFSRLDAFGSTLDPLSLGARPGQQQPRQSGLAGGGVDFSPPVSLSPNSGKPLGGLAMGQQNPFGMR